MHKSCFSRVRQVSFVVMARGDISVMPANVPEDMDWVEDVVLLSKSVVDEELLASFREAHAVCSTVEEESKYELVAPTSKERVCYYNLGHPEERHFIYMYECLFSKLAVRVPFTQFEQDVLFECRVAPTQLHPNSWGFMKAFQSVCWYLQLDLSLRAFLYFFHLTRPFSQKKSRWASFRAREGRRIFSLYEESFYDFKNYYFKVRRTIRSPHPAPSTEFLLLGPRIKWLRGQRLSSRLEGQEFKVPKTPATATEQSKSKKRKGFSHSYGSVYAPDFDVVGFTDEFIMENSRIALDEAGLKGNLEYVMRAGIKAAAISRALQKKLAKCPPTSRVELEQLKEKVATLVKGREEAEGQLSEAQAELAKMKKSAKEAERLRKKAEAEAAELQKKVGGLETDLAKLKEEYEELEDDSIKSNNNIVENFRLQAKILVPTLKVHLLHLDNYVAGSQIVWCSDLLPESGGPYFEEPVAEVGDAQKSEPQVEVDDVEKTPSV
ncbi:hypothetical protein PIB30_001344 [Stylosanthes scabra]|uniref:Transposase (putative) gypsy type domain-containing protein n=1 Tax=Stylosanthes scabra TaxID=79078 RepID=A0ABU6Y1H9_9FABA|nr:hypothetical protein [Stylosanthes scabra]